jgi:hypothetical protein
VHSHTAEVVSKARFEEVARRGIQRLARRTQYVMNNRWHSTIAAIGQVPIQGRTLQGARALFATRRTLASGNRMLTAITLPLQDARGKQGWRGSFLIRLRRGQAIHLPMPP